MAEGEDEAGGEIVELAALEKDCERIEQLGLSLAESKEILKTLQKHILERQVSEFVEARRGCPTYEGRLGLKGHHTVLFRTPFGDVSLDSPRLRPCRCSPAGTATFSPLNELLTEHTSPELLYLETKWSSLVSYGMTAGMLKDVLPVDEKLGAATVRNHALGVAERMEAELEDERSSFIDTCPAEWKELPQPDGPITVAMDGGYVRDWTEKRRHFEVIVGRSVTWQDCGDARDPPRDVKRFGFVYGYDEKPKRRLFELLKSQGMQMNQQVTFVSDGADNVRDLQFYLNPHAEHVLDWFHLTMRLTVLDQHAKGLARLDKRLGEEIRKLLGSVKWYCWHGNVYEALRHVRFVEMDAETLVYELEEARPGGCPPGPKKLLKAVGEFRVYIERNAAMIPNYGERRRYGETISTAEAEATVNAVLNKRFCKKQQMQWSKRGAHLLLQNRTRTLDRELEACFRRWYPDFVCEKDGPEEVLHGAA
ncbi:MAG: ISKra4 family transposase [Actinobacteria bacterium]|nr:MAG: ISKra4 family transposase [Actinomycetota bacterium]